jgi:hypothetical protein
LVLAKEQQIQPRLLLTPFVELYPELEFRAFVIEDEIIGKLFVCNIVLVLTLCIAISQRNLDIFKEYILLEKDTICELIETFYLDHLKRFPQKSCTNQ